MKKIDLTSSVFGRLTALSEAVALRSPSRVSTTWRCICECGNEGAFRTADLRSGKTKSCGCLLLRDKAEDIRGQRFGRLTVVARLHPKWICECDCGQRIMVRRNALTSGNTTSCGCKRIETLRERFTTHGLTNSGAHYSWQNMHTRCRCERIPSFKNYGGRGIKVCDRWLKFENFLDDMGERPKGLTLERKDVNGDYTPENCKWATAEEQSNNKRKSIRLSWHGETMTLGQWAKTLGLNYHTLNGRIRNYGWSVERALSTPCGK